MSPTVGDFRPSERGLHFANDFPPGTPALPGIPATISIPHFGSISVNDANNGLCGGMVFAVRDFFEAGRTPPADTTPPPSDSYLFRFLVQRLIDSWNLPGGVLRYLYLMNPGLPDQESWFEPWAHSRAWIMAEREWPRIQAELDGGRLTPLGLIRQKSWNPLDLSHQHQVLAYGYELSPGGAAIHVYDPNHPDDDQATLSLQVDGSERTGAAYSPVDEGFPDLFCFFRVDYTPKAPPG